MSPSDGEELLMHVGKTKDNLNKSEIFVTSLTLRQLKGHRFVPPHILNHGVPSNATAASAFKMW